jgi:hypothetical protein
MMCGVGSFLCADEGSKATAIFNHIMVFGERHLRHVLLSYMDCYDGARTHLSLNE